MLKIGISACFLYPDMDRKVFGPKTLSYIENDMATYLARKGILPVLIPNVSDVLLEAIVSEMDGFVFQGGTDLSPQSYGEEPIENGRWIGDPVRDAYELRLMDKAFKSEKPIFGICRGLQLMNVFFGGTLYQDTKTQRPDSNIHRDAEIYDHLHHEIILKNGSFLSEIYKGETLNQVNSIHHQSIKDLGKDLEIVASSAIDNVAEAIEYKKATAGKIFAVQWHPEFSNTLKEVVIDAEILYDHFINQVKIQKSIL